MLNLFVSLFNFQGSSFGIKKPGKKFLTFQFLSVFPTFFNYNRNSLISFSFSFSFLLYIYL